MRVDMATLLRIRKSQSPVTFGSYIIEPQLSLEYVSKDKGLESFHMWSI